MRLILTKKENPQPASSHSQRALGYAVWRFLPNQKSKTSHQSGGDPEIKQSGRPGEGATK
jgi:hypothetical protein